MGKYKDSPKYNIVSVRVTDYEKEYLEKIARKTSLNISTVLRMAFQLLTVENVTETKLDF